MTQQRQSTLPNNTPIRLPPLSPPSQSHPHAFNNSSLPVVYSLKLPQDVVKTLLSAHSTTSICFNKPDSGQIIIPNAKSIPFSVHPIADANASTGTARAACYTRRENSLRTVGPIIANLEVQRTLPIANPPTSKKRPLDVRNSGNTREMKIVDDIPAAQPAKKVRKKTVAKRPRAPQRTAPNLTSAPIPPSHANGIRAPRSTPPPPPPSNTSPPLHSPVVSPGHSNGKPNGSNRNGTSAFSAMQSHKVSPSPLVNLPKPVFRRTPTKPNRFSPVGSNVGSRGPSPSIINLPGSPRVAVFRPPNIGDQAELRRQVVHFLAMGENDLKSIKERLKSRRMEFSDRTLYGLLSEVAEVKGRKYVLREKSWADVTEKYEYSRAERAKMNVYRAEVDGSGSDKARTEERLDAAMDKFWKNYKETEEKVTCEKGESEMRRRFMDLYGLYTKVITGMEELQNVFKTLERRFLAAKSKEEKDDVARSITNNHNKLKGRHAKLERILPVLHTTVKRIRRALEDYSNNVERHS